jgi:hypothetical protein
VQPTGSGWLKFEIAGLAATPGVTLELRDAKTRAILADVRPRKVPGNAWRTVYVPEPSDAFVVAARGGPQHWLAFGEPVEMGRLSYWAWRIVRNGLLIAELAAGAVVLLALGAALDFVFCRRFAPP